ncbi:MAG: hypothetical protein KDI60_10550, partial [Xanthomonadales bacterium]|nr:hypothetical protein [Xanthomonadales bacterium]
MKAPPPNRESGARLAVLLDALIRRFGRAAHLIAVLLVYLIVAVAIGLALAPALWMLSEWLPWALAQS